jgi:ferredoxin
MRVKVDQSRCGRLGICTKMYPQVFQVPPGHSEVQVKLENLTPAMAHSLPTLARMCPNQAIVVQD